MPVTTSVKVIPGLSFPYFPPRPRTGLAVTSANFSLLEAAESGKYSIQPKLNGDRCELLVQGGTVTLANRHGGFYSFGAKNANDFLNLPDTTVLDGEVWKQKFYPFEAVVIGGKSLMRECPTVRAFEAEQIAFQLGHEWLFQFKGTEWLSKLRANLPTWEGVVLKKLGSPYLPLVSDSQNTLTWVKRKW